MLVALDKVMDLARGIICVAGSLLAIAIIEEAWGLLLPQTPRSVSHHPGLFLECAVSWDPFSLHSQYHELWSPLYNIRTSVGLVWKISTVITRPPILSDAQVSRCHRFDQDKKGCCVCMIEDSVETMPFKLFVDSRRIPSGLHCLDISIVSLTLQSYLFEVPLL